MRFQDLGVRLTPCDRLRCRRPACAGTPAPQDHTLPAGSCSQSKSTVNRRRIAWKDRENSPLEAQVAERVRSSAETIRQQVRNTLENGIKIGQELLAVKEALPHGQFLPWLRAEFGWAERTARNFMAVAEQFGKSAIIADLPIQPTAAYL